MTELRCLTAKKIQVFIKDGYTPEDICQKYGCEEPELKMHFSRLYRNSQAKAHKLYSALESNRRIAHKKTTDSSAKEPAAHEPIPAEAPDFTKSEPSAPESAFLDNPNRLSIEALESEEKILSNMVMILESDYQACIAKRRTHLETLRQLHREITQIEATVKERFDQFVKIIEADSENVTSSKQLWQQLTEKTAELETVREQIDNLKKVVLYVYADGHIEASERPDIILCDDGYLELARELNEKPECENLRIRDIRTLARLLKIVSKTTNPDGSQVNLEPVFDIAELETAFLALNT